MKKKKILILFSVLFLLIGGIQPHCIVTNVQAEETKSSNDFITYLLMLMMSRGITFNAQSIPDLEKLVSSAWGAYVVSQSLDDNKASIENGVSYGDSKVTASSESYYYASGFVNSLTGHYLSQDVNSFQYSINDLLVCSPGSAVFIGYADPSVYSGVGPGGSLYFYNNTGVNTFFTRVGQNNSTYIIIPAASGSEKAFSGSLHFKIIPGVNSYSSTDFLISYGSGPFKIGGSYFFNYSFGSSYYYSCIAEVSTFYSSSNLYSFNTSIPVINSFDKQKYSLIASNYGSSLKSIDAVVPGSLRQLEQPKSIDSDKVYEQQLKGILQGANSADQVIDKLADQVAKKLTATIGGKAVSISYPVTVEGDYVVSVPQELKQAIPTSISTTVPSSVPTSVPTVIPTIAPDAGSEYALKSVTSVFPFCVPYDVLELSKVLNVSAQAPSWDVPFKIPGVIDTSIHLGFDDFDTVNKVSRTCQVILFIIVLIAATRNLIGNG